MNIHPKIQNHVNRFTYYKDKFKYAPRNILDIGALDGRWSMSMKQVFTNAEFLMIEPNKEMEPILRKSKIQFLPCALSDVEKDADYFKLPGHAGNGLYRENSKYGSSIAPIVENIKTTTLESLFGNDRKFDLIKIDVQGSEIDVLNGGKEIAKKADLIVTECSLIEYNFNGPLIRDQINHFFDQLGFSLFDIVDLLYGKKGELLQIDALFKNKNFEFEQD